ncbi:MAG: CAP domain-containing protein [Christensenellales bacterium]
MHRTYKAKFLAFILCIFLALTVPLAARAASSVNLKDNLAKQMFALVNQERKKEGLPPYIWDENSVKLAKLKVQDMKENNYFAHYSPKYGMVYQMWTDMKLPHASVSENIAHHGSLQKAHHALMISTAHRKNIMSKGFNRIGIAVHQDKGGAVMVVQVFSRYR